LVPGASRLRRERWARVGEILSRELGIELNWKLARDVARAEMDPRIYSFYRRYLTLSSLRLDVAALLMVFSPLQVVRWGSLALLSI